MAEKKPVVLCILDGWGLRAEPEGNAVALARTPTFDRIMAHCPNATLVTSGPDVGLPDGQMGNSEVGHMNIGAGRIVKTDLMRINGVIVRGELQGLPGVRHIVDTMSGKGTVHMMGLLSDGGVHGHINHMIAMTGVLSKAGCDVALHLFSDGRDVAPKSGQFFINQLLSALPAGIRIVTLTGRYYAMDRDNRWERISRAYDAIVKGQGKHAQNLAGIFKHEYAAGRRDEFFEPYVIDDYAGMRDGDAVVFLNFRADRARQLLSAIGDPAFAGFDTGPCPNLALMTGFTEYSRNHSTYMDAIFPKDDIVNTLGAWVSANGLKQFRIAETEKYAHVTFFLNGGVDIPAEGEERYLAPSPRVATYDLQPEMSAAEVTENLVKAIHADYDLIVVNYANPDMVGHTGDLKATIKACESVDQGLARVCDALNTVSGTMAMVADHGNCETMIDPVTGGPHTAHTTNPVPVALIYGPKDAKLRSGRLADVAPTVLDLMGLARPPQMTGQSLLHT
ncbi:MAG: 2,3-bisphosphoglycerate-independent phosphoglycerate mutase [Rhodobacteraceae bacterium]|nr:2,3-bisphosphoglycerate-independent phosphoglycerate mutase [Paracoccaceae bacterium]